MRRNAWGWPMVGAGAVMFVVAALGGCPNRADDPQHGPSTQAIPSAPAADHTAVYDRADRRVAHGLLYKPSPSGGVSPALSEFAPLIVRRADERTPDAAPGLVVRASSASVRIDGRDIEQITYRWYDGAEPANPLNGVRATLDENRFPIIYEVLEPEGGVTVLFVSKSVEQGAADAHGAPLPGRRFSAERSVEDAPYVIVARVIEDGPQPMGPIIYVSPDGRSVETLICRCMPSQVDELVASETYPLVPDDAPPPSPADLSSRLRIPPRP